MDVVNLDITLAKSGDGYAAKAIARDETARAVARYGAPDRTPALPMPLTTDPDLLGSRKRQN